MAEKFPGLGDSKQRAFGLDMARFGEKGSRAAVVVAERARLSLHWSRADGTWGVTTRDHNALSQAPRRPDGTPALGWSGRVGVAASGDDVVLVYKRRFPGSDSSDLFIDPFAVDPGTGELGGRFAPLRLPRAGLGITRVGFSVWADISGGRLMLVAQVARGGAAVPPVLALLDTSWPKADSAAVENAAEWTVTDLDAGGWDFDAKREGSTLAILHRRDAATHILDVPVVDPAFGGSAISVSLSDAANAPIRLSQLRVPSLALVHVDLPGRVVTSVESDLGFGENPRIHGVTPLVATVDRLEGGTIGLHPGQIRLTRLRSETFLLMRTTRGWRTGRLLNQTLRWAATRERFARVQLALSVGPTGGGPGLRLSWAPLWSERPTVLFRRQDTDKGTLLTFGHQDPDLGALRATTFRVFEDDGGETLRAEAEQFAVLDIGHRHVRGPQGDEREPDEHRQLRPHRIDRAAFHADVPNEGLEVVREEDGGNTLAGMLTAAADRPESGYAYTEMGDGGVRVMFEGGLDLPPPTATVEEKEFQPQWVAEPPLPGRAWVRLAAQDFVDTRLPGVFAPPTLLNAVSLACLQQQALDGLSLAADANRSETPVSPADPLTFGFADSGRVGYAGVPDGLAGGLVTSVTVTEDAAGALQSWVTDNSALAPPRPAVSDAAQPFPIEIRRPHSQVFAGDRVEFEAGVPGAATAGYQFDWAFSDGGTDTGIRVRHVFTATRPDFSRANPGGIADPHRITLTVTAPDGRVSTASTTLALERSLWATLWTAYSAFRQAPDNILDDDGDWNVTEDEWASYLSPGMFVRDVTTSFYRYSLRYVVNEAGRGTRVEVTIRDEHSGRFRFLGNPSGQGDVEYEVPVRARLTGVVLTGDFGGGLGTFVQINSVEVTLRCLQRFTPGVQTSERRDGHDDSETVERNQLFGPTTMMPSALCALPVERLVHTVGEPDVDGGVSGTGWALGIIVPALISAVGTAAVLAILLPLLLVVAPVIVGALTVSLVVSLLVGAGVGALATLLLDLLVVRPLVRSTIRERLAAPEVATSLREAGLMTYAGEGLSEAIAIALIRQAQADGHAVADPENEGRDRFRSPFVETIVVSEGACKAQVRV